MSKSMSEKYVDSIKWIRTELLEMDEIANPIMGINEWDDAVCMDFSGRIIVSCDGPYDKRLVMKSALVHAATDVIVKGGRPIFAVECITGELDDVKQMVQSLKIQSNELKIPILGGNTKYEDVKPTASITVVGKLLIDKPIRDSESRSGDKLVLIGEPIWGEQEERLVKAGTMIEAWYEIIKTVRINSAKDVTKGGLIATVYEMGEKSGKNLILNEDINLPLNRNLDNFIISLQPTEFEKIVEICNKRSCPFEIIGQVE